VRRLAFSALLFLVCGSAVADTCVSTIEAWSSVSSSGEWKLVVTPVVTGKHEYARAALYQRKNAVAWRRKAHWRLINDYGPMSAMVAGDGTSVTFDNGCSYGVGTNVVVIYRPDGRLVRTLALPDLLVETDVAVLPRSVSSIHWSGTHRLDEEKRQLILQVKGPGRTAELPVSLDTGELLVPKRKLFFVTTYTPVASYAVDAADETKDRKCEGGVVVGSAELLSRASVPVNPVYPPVAIKARIHGDVLLELTTDEDGYVAKVNILKPLPFGLDQAAYAAASQWQFQPLDRDGRRVRMCGRLIMRFAMIPD
jgi:TonB family protein